MIRVKKEVVNINTTTNEVFYDCIEGDLWVVQEMMKKESNADFKDEFFAES